MAWHTHPPCHQCCAQTLMTHLPAASFTFPRGPGTHLPLPHPTLKNRTQPSVPPRAPERSPTSLSRLHSLYSQVSRRGPCSPSSQLWALWVVTDSTWTPPATVGWLWGWPWEAGGHPLKGSLVQPWAHIGFSPPPPCLCLPRLTLPRDCCLAHPVGLSWCLCVTLCLSLP